MQMDDMILVSVDDHVVEPPSLGDFFRENLPAKFKDRAPKVIRRDDGTDAWLIEGKEIATFGLNAVQGRPPENWGRDPSSFDQVRPGCYDVHERIRDMNVNGVLASINFPSWPGLGGQFFMQNTDDEFVAAMTRTYNDWHLHDWCNQYPGRFIPLAISGFTLGAEWMAGEIRRLADLGCHAVSCHPDGYRFGAPDYHGDEWDPAWKAAEETGSVIVFHFGGFPNFMPRTPFSVIPHAMPFQMRSLPANCCGRRSSARSPSSRWPWPRVVSGGSPTSWRKRISCTNITARGRGRTSATSCRARFSASTCRVASSTTSPGCATATQSAST